MKPYQQTSLNFGFDEPAATEISVILEKEIPLAKEVAHPQVAEPIHEIAKDPVVSPVKVPVTDESTVLTIRKKPGRKEKEKVWKSATPGKRGRKSLKDIASEVDLIDIPDDE